MSNWIDQKSGTFSVWVITLFLVVVTRIDYWWIRSFVECVLAWVFRLCVRQKVKFQKILKLSFTKLEVDLRFCTREMRIQKSDLEAIGYRLACRDWLPVLCPWLWRKSASIDNKSTQTVAYNRITNHTLGVLNISNLWFLGWVPWRRS